VESFRQWYASEKSKPFWGTPIRATKQSWPQNHTPKTHTREKRIEAFLVDTLKGVFAIVGLDGSAEFFRQAAREFRLWCSELSIDPSCGEALAAWGKVMIGVYDFNQWCTSNEIEPLWGPFADPNTNNGVSDADGKALIDQMPVKCCENFPAFRGQEGRAKGHLVVFDGGKSA
jgi:hypothetical protein